MSVVSNPQNNDNVVITPPNSNKVVVNKQTSDKVVVTKTAQEVLRVATGIKGDTGPQGPVGPVGPTGDPGVYVGATAPTDTDLLWVDTSYSITGGSSQQIFGLADPQDYADLPKVLVERTNTTTGWVAVNPALALTVNTSFGAGKEAILCGLAAGTNNINLTSKLYKNFSIPLDMGVRTSISFEFMRDWRTGEVPSKFEFVAATGVNLTGTLFTQPIPDVGDLIWTSVFVDVPLGTVISSFGIRSVTYSVGTTDRWDFYIRDICLEPVSKVQVAQLAGKTPVVTEAATEGTRGYLNPLYTTPKLDLRRDSAVFPGLNGWWDAREWGIPEDGVTDTTPYIQQMLVDLPDGACVRFPTNSVFLVSGTIYVRKPVTIDFNNALLYDPVRRPATQSSNNFISVSGYVTDVTLLNGKIYATKSDTFNAGGNLSTISGVVTTSGTTAVLTSVGDSGEHRPADQYDRWLGQHYEFGYGINNRYDAQVSGDGTASVKLEIITDSGLSVASTTVTPPATPTSYTLRCNPPDLGERLFMRFTKISGASPIVIHTVTPWGMSNYDSDYEFSNGIVVQNASRVLVENWWIENVGGEATVVQCFDKNLGYVTFKNVTGRCGHTQNHAPTSGRFVTYENCYSFESGRSGFDCEPYGTGWALDHLTIRNCTSRNDLNYALSVNNWGFISNLTVENFKAFGWGIGAFIGGARGGRITGITSTTTRSYSPASIAVGFNPDVNITGKDLVVSDLSLVNGITVNASTWTTDGTYTAGGNSISNFTINGWTSVGEPSGAIRIKDGTSTISGGAFPSGTVSLPATPYGVIYGSAAEIVGRPPLFGFDLGRWRKVLPKTFKGLAMDGLWWPYGIDASDSLVSTKGISATAIRPQNLRGISNAVTVGAASASVLFPIKGGGANIPSFASPMFSATASTYSGTKTVSLSTGTAYYYTIGAIVDYDDNGHRPALFTATGASLTTVNKVYSLAVRGRIDWNSQTSLAGFAIYRGTGGSASGGPWDARYMVKPTGPWYSSRQDAGAFVDTGTYLVTPTALLSDREYGYPNINTDDGAIATVEYGSWNLTTGPFTDTSGYEADTNYSIIVTPSWGTTVAVTAKRQSGFDVSFGTPAPAGATFDWILIR